MMKNTRNLYKWTAVCCAALLAALLILARTDAQTHINISWKKVLEQENRRVDNQGVASVLGVRVGAQIEHIRKQNDTRKYMQKAFTQLPKGTAEKAEANYNRIQTLIAKNQLFKGYELTVPVLCDLYQLNAAELKHVLAFCNGNANPTRAKKYKRGLLLTLRVPETSADVFLQVDVQNKIISLVYNDPADLDENLLSGKCYELQVQ
ncbi:MAG: hypothetical protein PUK24_05555 [Elusimicrobia bacterium]|nr:hypothetical protein [Elusimicrobiota bacterium]